MQFIPWNSAAACSILAIVLEISLPHYLDEALVQIIPWNSAAACSKAESLAACSTRHVARLVLAACSKVAHTGCRATRTGAVSIPSGFVCGFLRFYASLWFQPSRFARTKRVGLDGKFFFLNLCLELLRLGVPARTSGVGGRRGQRLR